MMTLVVPNDLEERLSLEATRLGIPPVDFALRLLDQHLPPPIANSSAVALLQTWIDGEDAEDQKQTGSFLVQALDEDRLSDRKLFPPELEGVTW